jgi:hypothetical protein
VIMSSQFQALGLSRILLSSYKPPTALCHLASLK